jgi:hypothetical protein
MAMSDLPPTVAAFVSRLKDAGFEETGRDEGSMDSGWVHFRRSPMEIALSKDRSQWSVQMRDVQWRDWIAFPLLEGFGRVGAVGDPFAPRRDRDPARDYDVPDSVRWLIRQLLVARLTDASAVSDAKRLAFQRDTITVLLERDPSGWSVRVRSGEWDAATELALPRFEGFTQTSRHDAGT